MQSRDGASPSLPDGPITTLDAWRGPELAGDGSWTYRLTEDDVSELLAARAAAGSRGPWRTWNRSEFPLPRLGPRIAQWMRELDLGPGFKLIRGFPVDQHSKEVCAEIYWGLGLHMGRAISQNTDGDLLGHVRDTGADPKAYGVRLYKTRAEQDFHTDGADVIGLFCLRRARSGGVSRIVSSSAIYNAMLAERPDLTGVLFSNFPFDTQGQHPPGGQPWFERPLCRWDGVRLNTFFIPWYIRESQQHPNAPRLTPDQAAAIAFIETKANDPAFHLDMNFEPGDMQFLKNAAILHKRTEYEDWEAPDLKRHLLRLWLVEPDFSAGDERLRRGVSQGA
ncbi:MAG: TauD/TfdA family dioxygenase [Caulobacteraceae bacterium]